MSATGRGAVRRADDFYETPEWLTRALFRALGPREVSLILEPSAGAGAVSRVVAKTFPAATIHEFDLHPRRRGILRRDTLSYVPKNRYDLIITNPPYSLAEEFCRFGLAHRKPHGIVAMLLRLNFLGSQKRATWLRGNIPSIYVSPRRPSFIGKTTDACEYAWFVWDCRQPSIQILETEKCRARRGVASEPHVIAGAEKQRPIRCARRVCARTIGRCHLSL